MGLVRNDRGALGAPGEHWADLENPREGEGWERFEGRAKAPLRVLAGVLGLPAPSPLPPPAGTLPPGSSGSERRRSGGEVQPSWEMGGTPASQEKKETGGRTR